MDPQDLQQHYYYGQQGQHQDAYPSSSSGGPSYPTTPQNGFVPIYTTHDPNAAASYTTYDSSMAGPAYLSDQSQSPQTLEEHELKRLRNTAASARFRAKKKQRQTQLETSAREKKERLEALEKRIQDLEEENKWLKALIVEKRDVSGEVRRMRERFGMVEEEMREFVGEHTDGVGTD